MGTRVAVGVGAGFGGGPALWTPAELGAVLWTVAADLVNDGGNVNAWANRGSGADLTSPGTDPTFEAGPPKAAQLPGLLSDGFLSAFANSAWIVWAIVGGPISTSTDNANPWTNSSILNDTGAFWGLHVRDNSGDPVAQIYSYDGATKVVSQDLPTAGRSLIAAGYNGASPGILRIEVNGSGSQIAGPAQPDNRGGTVRVGAIAGLTAKVHELGAVASYDAETFANLLAYSQRVYGTP